MLDSRNQIRSFFQEVKSASLHFIFGAFSFSFLVALAVAFLPSYHLSDNATSMLFILVFAALLWITEAIEAYAVSLLIITLEIILLGFSHGIEGAEWKIYLESWSNPLVFLFLAGFIMAIAATKIKLDIWISKKILFLVGNKPKNILAGIMGVTYVLSMFISNTATAAMMITILLPIVRRLNGDKFATALLLGVAAGANLGGMATIIGTPPNAIAVGVLGSDAPNFLQWMLYAMPPSLFIVILLYFLLLKLFPASCKEIDIEHIAQVEHFDDSTKDYSAIPRVPSWKKLFTIAVFSLTLLMWLTTPLHHIPTTVISFLPIVTLTAAGIITAEDITKIRWDVIILIVGGLSLGFGVTHSGLSSWFATLLPEGYLSYILISIAFSYTIVLISNFMSNTAATNILLPIAISITSTAAPSQESFVAISVALSASFAMAFVVATPPNAIVFSTNYLNSREFLVLGVVAGILGPLSAIGWLWILL